MAVQFPQISADTISGIGDPWVAEMHKQRVQGILQQAGGDYRKAAMALMSIDPASAAQLIKLSGQQQAAGHQAEALKLQREQMDKPSAHFDTGTGRWFEYRPKGPDGGVGVRWLTDVPPTQSPDDGSNPPPAPTFNPATPQREPGGAVVPNQGNVYTVPGSTPRQGAGAVPPLPDGVTRADIAKLRLRPDIDKRRWEGMFNLQPGDADRMIQAYGSSSMVTPSPDQLGQFADQPGAIMRVAGSEQDLPPEISQAFAQASPRQAPPAGEEGQAVPPPQAPQGQYNQGRIPSPPPPPQAGQPYPPPQQPRRGPQFPLDPMAMKKYNLDMATKQGEMRLKDQEEKQKAAETAMPYVELANRMEKYARAANQAGLANNFMQFAPVSGGLGMARGIYETLSGGKQAPGIIGQSKWSDLYEQERARMELQASSAFKGQGAVSDNERRILQKGLPSLALMNTPEGMAQIAEYRRTLYDVIRRGGMGVPGVD